ncbi:MAG: nucleoside monophosphate kinase [Verrucomicrobia bacterium]|nr:nucleoside monophosphate kinase [Verrucomicrobiota bacterium]
MNISIVGTKGAGKGTQVSRLAKDFNLLVFASGDAFRAGVKQHTPLGKIAQKYIAKGDLVPDDIVNGLVEEWIWTTSPNQGIIFDGFPRTTFQAAFLENTLSEMGRKFDVVIYLDVSDEQVIKRLSERRICHLCLEEFHLASSPFKVCPRQRCQGEHLRHLDEDKPEVISTLVKMFQRGIEPLLQHYESSGRLIEINGDLPVDEVHSAIVPALMPYR